MPVDVAVTVQGSTLAARAVSDAGALVGMESGDSEPPDHFDVDFVDYPFTKAGDGFPAHLAAVRRREPALAVAPDVEPPRTLKDVLRRAERLNDHAETVIVPVKQSGDADPGDIPPEFRVGLPFAEGFGSGGLAADDPAIDSFANAAGGVHVLGGNPGEQLQLQGRVDVRSVDTSLPVLYARKGRVWLPEGQIETGGHLGGMEQRLRESVAFLRAAWGHDVDTLWVPDGYREFLDGAAYPATDRDHHADFARAGHAPGLLEHHPETGRIPDYIDHDLRRRRDFGTE